MILKREEKIFTLVAHPYKEEDAEEDSFKTKNSRTTYSKRTTRKSRSGMGLTLILTVLGQRGFRRVVKLILTRGRYWLMKLRFISQSENDL